jgi:hypothetical protein
VPPCLADTLALPLALQVRTDGQEIEAYFKDFLQRQPGGKIIESYVLDEGSVLVFNGIYDFSLLDPATSEWLLQPANGQDCCVPAGCDCCLAYA